MSKRVIVWTLGILLLAAVSIAVQVNAKQNRTADQALSAGALFTQPDTLRNSRAASAANTAQNVDIAAVSGQQVNLYALTLYATGGTTTCEVDIQDAVAGTVIWKTLLTGGAAPQHILFNPALSNPAGNGLRVAVAACGVAVISQVSVVASQFN